MNFLEMDLEQIIFKTDNQKLNKKGLWIGGKKYRQLRIGKYGIADLVTVERHYKMEFDFDKHLYVEKPFLVINVMEIKRGKVGISAFLQAVRYCKGIRRYLEYRGFSQPIKTHITLVGREADTTSDFSYLTDLVYTEDDQDISWLQCFSYEYGADGIEFTEHSNYNLIDEGFNSKKRANV